MVQPLQDASALEEFLAQVKRHTADQQQQLERLQSLVHLYQQEALQQRAVQETSSLNVQLTLPPGAFPGTSCSFQAPDGRRVTFEVPQGFVPNMSIVISYCPLAPTEESLY